MDLTPPIPGNSPLQTPLTPVFGDNVQNLLNAGALNVKPTAIIVVNSIDDVANSSPGVTTLRDAVNKANADSNEDLIVFDRSLFSSQQTITLKLGELDITHNLDIIAPRDSLTGGDLVTVNQQSSQSLVQIEAKVKVSIDGLIVSGGASFNGAVDNKGIAQISNSIISQSAFSGIFNSGTLTLHNSTLTGNGFGNLGSSGGGINNRGTAQISNSIITGSKAQDGGGIYTSSGTVKINNSTISNNSVNAFGGFGGGGIYIGNGSTVAINNSTISGNSSTRSAGGIANFGTLTIGKSTISGNTSGAVGFGGGGIYNSSSLTILNSTISNNITALNGTSGGGGGVFNSNSGTLIVTNSTISGNTGFYGGGISNAGVLTLLFSTIAANQTYGGQGGGVFSGNLFGSFLGSTTVRNTIIAGNLFNNLGRGPFSPDDVSGNFTSNGYNLIGDGTGSTGFDPAKGDIVGTSGSPINPHLGVLASNGGPTQTIALLPGSPAINAGDPTVLPTDPKTDQRGKPRVQNGRADIGAFESSF